MSTWSEVRKLQEELFNVQQHTAKNKLSERNCISIIQRLLSLGWLEVYFSCDGKEYITPRQLKKDILDELYMSGGRIALTDLAQTLNIDYSHVEKKVSELLSQDSNLSVHYGELISKQFFDNLAVEVNEALQETGFIPLTQLSHEVSIPVATLSKELVPRVGDLIIGTYDKEADTLYTTAFVDRQIAKLRGACSAATRPVQLGKIMELNSVSSSLGYSCVKDLVSSGRLKGKLQGQSSNPVFIPALFVSAQNQWADGFYEQNGYLTYDMMSNKGIDNMSAFVSKYKNAISVPSGIVSENKIAHTQSVVDDAITSNSYIETTDWVYEWCRDEDIYNLIEVVVNGTSPNLFRVLPNKCIVSVNLLNNLLSYFDATITERVQKDVLDPKVVAALKKFDDAASVVVESKVKKAKGGKKGKKGKKNDDDDIDIQSTRSVIGPTFMSITEIVHQLEGFKFFIENEPKEEETLAQISELLKPQLNEKYCRSLEEEVRKKTQKSTKTQQKSTEASINNLYNTIILCEKGLKCFEDSVRQLIEKHILKSLASELTKSTFLMLAEEYDCPFSGADMKLETLVPHLPKDAKTFATSVISSINGGSSVEEFLECYTNLTDPKYTQILVKKQDKKKERNMVFSQKQSLLEQLKTESSSGELLNIACSLMFIKQNSALLHAPGRAIAGVVKALSTSLSKEQADLLNDLLGKVVSELKGEQSLSDEDKNSLRTLVTDVLFGQQQGSTE